MRVAWRGVAAREMERGSRAILRGVLLPPVRSSECCSWCCLPWAGVCPRGSARRTPAPAGRSSADGPRHESVVLLL